MYYRWKAQRQSDDFDIHELIMMYLAFIISILRDHLVCTYLCILKIGHQNSSISISILCDNVSYISQLFFYQGLQENSPL